MSTSDNEAIANDGLVNQQGHHLVVAPASSWRQPIAVLTTERTWRLRRLGPWHLAGLVLCLAVGAAINPWRAAFVAVPPPVFRGFFVPDERVDGTAVRWARQYAKVEFIGLAWRPMRVALSVMAHPSVTVGEITAVVSVNDRVVRRVLVQRGWQEVDFEVDGPASDDLALQIETFAPPGQERAVGVGEIRPTAVITTSKRFTHGLVGALGGLAVWLLFVIVHATPPPAQVPARAGSPTWVPDAVGQRSIRFAAILFVAIALYLGLWLVLKPALQSPDEPQHLLRSNSVLKQAWRDPPSVLKLDERFANPVALEPTTALWKVFFDRTQKLDAAQIDELKRIPWSAFPIPATVPTPLTTYPAGYYGIVFGLAEPVTRLFGLTPYQSLYLYRLVTVLLASALWVLVYRVLREVPDTADRAGAMLAFLLLNPMLAFVTSSVTPDAVNNPLAALGILLIYRVGLTGKHIWPATLALLACAMTKPSGLLILAASAASFALLWLSRALPFEHAGAVGLAIGRAAVVSVLGFYAWSPPRFAAGPPVTSTLNGYLDVFWDRLPDVWVEYWGKLGWLDYSASPIWYQMLLILVVVNAVIAARRGVPVLARFAAGVFAVYLVLMMVGEFRFLRVAGYNFQGRHLLPAMMGSVGLVLHRVRWAWVSLLVVVGLMNVALVFESVQRYFNGDWWLVLESLPF